MAFLKEYVRVESLAISRAIDLARKAGFPDLYLAKSYLSSEEGYVRAIARASEVLFNAGGRPVYFKELGVEGVGLGDEIGVFMGVDPHDQEDYADSSVFLRRHYMFDFNDPKRSGKKLALLVHVVLAKITEDSDWKVLVESAFTVDEHGNQAHDPVVYND